VFLLILKAEAEISADFSCNSVLKVFGVVDSGVDFVDRRKWKFEKKVVVLCVNMEVD